MLVGPHYHNGLLEYPLLAADLHQPYRLEQWADGISYGPHCHNNARYGLGPHCHNTDGLEAGLDWPPFHLVGLCATFSPCDPLTSGS